MSPHIWNSTLQYIYSCVNPQAILMRLAGQLRVRHHSLISNAAMQRIFLPAVPVKVQW